MTEYRVFIGYDPRQVISFQVLAHSIVRNASKPISITPLIIEQLPLKRQGLTPFTYSRFLVPHICNYTGKALFLDADMLCKGDIVELFDLCEIGTREQAWVVKNKVQFEWASLIMFNNACCGILSPDYIETAKGLHKMEWAERIGELPAEWNHCIGYDDPNPAAKLVHFTQGVPAWFETQDSEHADDWRAELDRCNFALPWRDLMARSVHARPVLERLFRGYQEAATKGAAA